MAPQGGSCVPASNDVIDRLKADSRALASDGIPALLELAITRSPGSHTEGSVLIDLIRRMRQNGAGQSLTQAPSPIPSARPFSEQLIWKSTSA
jgi:hypothetical protein